MRTYSWLNILKLITDIVNTDREFLSSYDDNLHESTDPGRVCHNTCGKGLSLCFAYIRVIGTKFKLKYIYIYIYIYNAELCWVMFVRYSTLQLQNLSWTTLTATQANIFFQHFRRARNLRHRTLPRNSSFRNSWLYNTHFCEDLGVGSLRSFSLHPFIWKRG